MNFPRKGLCQFLNIPIDYHYTKNQKKLRSYSREKCQTARMTDGRTDNSDFIVPSNRGPNIKPTSSFPEFTKNQFVPLVSLGYKVNFRSWDHRGRKPIFLDQILISMKLLQYAKKSGFLIIFFKRYSWLNEFCPSSQEPEFSQIWDLPKHIPININFHIDQIEKKVITKFSCKFKEP